MILYRFLHEASYIVSYRFLREATGNFWKLQLACESYRESLKLTIELMNSKKTKKEKEEIERKKERLEKKLERLRH